MGSSLRMGLAAGLVLGLMGACSPPDAPRDRSSAADRGIAGEPHVSAARVADATPVRPDHDADWPPAEDSLPGTPWTRQDWDIFESTLRAADAAGLAALPAGDAVAEMGFLFLGTPYRPRTLEVPGPERLVVNFRALDCVTFVENVLALTRFHRVHGVAALQDPNAARRDYEAILRELRYRDGWIQGYPSRLHYFSEWIREGVEAGRLADATAALGGVPDTEPFSFMTAHADAYPQLAGPEVRAAVQRVEAALNADPARFYLPQAGIAEAAAGIRTGDIIAATSTLAGLDVAHTGIALWQDGRLHLLHAPLVGETVTISERPLARRIVETSSQDGILVARPLESWLPAAGFPARPGAGG